MRFGNLVFLIFLVWQLFTLSSCTSKKSTETMATINLLVDDAEMSSASVTGKELLWSKWQVKWKDSTGRIQFKAHIKEADLLKIKSNNSYKTFSCYLEAGQTLNVIYKPHQYAIVGNSIAARQNQLLQKVNRQMTLFNSKQESEQWARYHALEKLVADFQEENQDASPVFLHFVQFNIRYFLYYQLLGGESFAFSIYNDLSDQELKLLNNVKVDSNYDLAYLSPYYRKLLNKYIDYNRVRAFSNYLIPDENPVNNELALVTLLKSDELKEYQMATSLKKLFHVGCNLNLEHAIDKNTGYWKNFLLTEYREASNRINTSWNLEQNQVQQIDISTNAMLDMPFDLDIYRGSWVYIEITKGSLGYSPFETYHLKYIKNRLNNLQYVFISLATENIDRKAKTDFPLVVKINEAELATRFKTKTLPYSLLLDPDGKVALVNLPRASTGMLEPMLHNLIAKDQ